MENAIQIQNNVRLEKLLTTDPVMEQYIQTAIGYVLEQARRDVVSKAASVMRTDPKGASRAVRRTLYKQILGGQLNILRKKRAGHLGTVPPQEPRTGRGGNRRARSADTERMMVYQGSDRGFILRFVNKGTEERATRYGNRGSILGTDFFGPAAKTAIEEAVPLLIQEFEKIVTEQSNQ